MRSRIELNSVDDLLINTINLYKNMSANWAIQAPRGSISLRHKAGPAIGRLSGMAELEET